MNKQTLTFLGFSFNKQYLWGCLIGIIGISTLLLVLHTNTPQAEEGTPIRIVTSFYPLYFFASEIGGTKANIINITPPNSEPHDYEPTPRVMSAIEKSDIIILTGGHFEAWGDNVKKNIDPSKTLVINVGEDLATQTLKEENKNIPDMHVWLSPLLAKEIVRSMLNAFVLADQKNKDYYTQNAANLIEKLSALDLQYRNELTSCARKDFVTAHAAFGYLATTYGLEQISIAGLSPDVEPSLKQLGEIAQIVEERRIPVIFFETLTSPKLVQTLAKETNTKTLVLDPIEGLSNEDSEMGKDYFTLMRDNLENLKIALSCTP